MQTPKKDWTQQERDRFERVFCAILARGILESTNEIIKHTTFTIEALDNHYQNTSNEQSTNNN